MDYTELVDDIAVTAAGGQLYIGDDHLLLWSEKWPHAYVPGIYEVGPMHEEGLEPLFVSLGLCTGEGPWWLVPSSQSGVASAAWGACGAH